MVESKPIVGGEVGQAAKERALALIGRTLQDRYRIEELVAMGGIAAVFRATTIASGKDVAVKFLHPEAEGLPEMIERFEREAVAGKHIFHPNVAAVHEIQRMEDGSWFLVLDFIRGRTLRDIIAEGPMPPVRAAKIARQMSAGLTAAHDMGIVHRDVKPRNIMVSEGPEEIVQLIDFGLAKVPLERLAVAGENIRNSLTQAGVVLGTVAYMAPEAALGMRAIDRRADLYALGLILYEMLAGKHPFTAQAPSELFKQHRTQVPPPIAERSPGIVVPASLEAVVQRLLLKDPDERYPHARSVTVALDAAIREIESPAAPMVPAPVSSIRVPGSRRAIVAVAGAVLVVIGVIVWIVLTK